MTEATDKKMTSDSTWNDKIHISKHPVLFHKISILRSANTSSGQFREVLKEVTYHLAYEATADLKTREIPVTVSHGKESKDEHMDICTGHKIADHIALIPILRSGLGMTDAFLELLPQAAVHHIGMYHLPGAQPVQYFNRLPRKCTADVAFVVDPVVASAETVLAVFAILKKWGVKKIHLLCVLASKQGLSKIQESHPDVHVTVGMVDDVLTDNGIVLPGMGDCGNRLYATQPILDDKSIGVEEGDSAKRVRLE